ncbi:MAG TPA: hypothetical protein VF795_10365 [Desulfuromonadaceae bacterium]
MRIPTAMVALLLSAAVAWAAPVPPSAPKMRPYCGIGVLMLANGGIAEAEESYRLYDEPALARLGELDLSRVPPYEWIFGAMNGSQPLVVTARKGEWLRVAYDDAGREAWLELRRPAAFQSWEEFLKGRTVRLLPGLQKRYYQLFREAGRGAQAGVSPKEPFRAVRLMDDWILVLSGQNTLGWLRWRDEDGRLLVGLGRDRP